jgi:hypothetical protein
MVHNLIRTLQSIRKPRLLLLLMSQLKPLSSSLANYEREINHVPLSDLLPSKLQQGTRNQTFSYVHLDFSFPLQRAITVYRLAMAEPPVLGSVEAKTSRFTSDFRAQGHE